MPSCSICRRWDTSDDYPFLKSASKKIRNFYLTKLFLWQLKEQHTAVHPVKNYMQCGMKKEDLLIFKLTRKHIVQICGSSILKTITRSRSATVCCCYCLNADGLKGNSGCWYLCRRTPCQKRHEKLYCGFVIKYGIH